MPEKLVRDLIGLRIARGPDEHLVRRARRAERHDLLCRKLAEEVGEYLASRDHLELADVLEVVMALAAQHDIRPEVLEGLRDAKWKTAGGFDDLYVMTVAEYSHGERAFMRQLVERGGH